MHISDYIFIAKSNLSRRKKSVFTNSMLIVISMLVLILSLSFTSSLKVVMNRAIIKNISYRTISITSDAEKSADEIIDEIQELNYVEKVIKELDYSTGASVFTIDNEKIYGYISLIGANRNIQPNVIIGRNIDKDENNVCIIPKEFYPYNILNGYNKSKVIDGESLIGKTIEIDYNSYYYKPFETVTKNTFKKGFTVIGVYDSEDSVSNNNECYISFDDVHDIYTTSDNDSEIVGNHIMIKPNSVYAIIDNSLNMENAINDIQKLGYRAMPKSTANIDLVNIVNIVAILVTSIILIIVISNLIISSIKAINERSYEIGMLKAIGYKNSNIQNIVFTENLIIGFMSYVITIILACLIMLIIKYVVISGNYELEIINFKLNFAVCLIAFAISTIVTLLTAKISAQKALAKTIVQLNREG